MFKTINDYVYSFGDFLKDYLLLAFRLYWGWNFFLAGSTKFGNIHMVTEFFDSVHIPFPLYQAYLVATIETVGGLFLFMGFISRIVSVPLAFIMIVALCTAHLSETSAVFHNPQRLIIQLPFNYLITCLLILGFGPGRFSMDHLIRKLGYPNFSPQ
jgi:putative oxidoreductase